MHIWFGSPSIQLENGISLGLGGYILEYGPIVVNLLILSIVTHHMQNNLKILGQNLTFFSQLLHEWQC